MLLLLQGQQCWLLRPQVVMMLVLQGAAMRLLPALHVLCALGLQLLLLLLG